MIKRDISEAILSVSSKIPVISVLGPRQSGKTTLVKNIFNKHTYISLEDSDIRARALNDPRGFLQFYSNEHGIILDEVQNAPELLSYIQTIVDSTQRPASFIITGSQNILVHKAISQTLAGRIILFTLLPLSSKELKNTPYQFTNVDDAILHGGYPRLLTQNLAPSSWFPTYIETYVERDVRQIQNILDLSTFQKFIRLCAGRIGQVVNLTSLGNDCGVSAPTIKSWLSLLQTSYIIFMLQPYHKNFNKRLIKSPKIYFYDTGLACSLLSIKTTEQLFTHYLRGSLFENFVITDLIKNQYNSGDRPSVYFWRDKTGNEVDCILEHNTELKAIEIKASATGSNSFFDGLVQWQKLAKTTSKDNFVIYAGNENQPWKQGTIISWNSISDLIK